MLMGQYFKPHDALKFSEKRDSFDMSTIKYKLKYIVHTTSFFGGGGSIKANFHSCLIY